MPDSDKIIPYRIVGINGCHPDKEDERDFSYDQLVMGAPPVAIDWDKGFDIRNLLNDEIYIKNQYITMSCVGQGWSYYLWVKQVIEMMKRHKMDLSKLRIYHKAEVDEISAKAFYSQIFIEPDGGAYIRDAAKLAVNWGALFEKIVPSTNNGRTTEGFMRDKSWLNAKTIELAKALRGLEYRVINAADNMDLFAQAIIQNHGVVGGLIGQSGRGWGTENPLPPTEEGFTWGHCVFYGAIGTDEKGRFIATPNSWSDAFQNPKRTWKPGSKPGDGWQKLRADYFNNKYQFNPWTFVDKDNMPETNAKIVKDTNSLTAGIWIPAISQEALESYCKNFAIDIPRNPDKSINWDEFIQGELTLKK